VEVWKCPGGRSWAKLAAGDGLAQRFQPAQKPSDNEHGKIVVKSRINPHFIWYLRVCSLHSGKLGNAELLAWDWKLGNGGTDKELILSKSPAGGLLAARGSSRRACAPPVARSPHASRRSPSLLRGCGARRGSGNGKNHSANCGF
jgi:hypothetical protein